MKRLVFTVLALQDFQEIHDYIAKDNADIALNFIERLQERCNSLRKMPNVGRKREELNPKLRSATESDYIIFYRPLLNEIEIVRVIHGKRDLSKINFPEST